MEKDLELTRKVILADDTVDELFDKVKEKLVSFLAKNDNSGKAIDMLMIAKYLERIGIMLNIAEWVGVSITGVEYTESVKGTCKKIKENNE